MQKLSYAEKVQMMNSILLCMVSYWAHISLPEVVINTDTKVCTNFFMRVFRWQRKYVPVSWSSLRLAKTGGGMGIKDGYIWNVAALCKPIWNIAQKADCIWIRSIDHYYLQFWPWYCKIAPMQQSCCISRLSQGEAQLKDLSNAIASSPNSHILNPYMGV